MKTGKTTLIGLFLLSLTALAPRAHAVTDTLTDATAINAAAIKVQPPSTDQICDALLGGTMHGSDTAGQDATGTLGNAVFGGSRNADGSYNSSGNQHWSDAGVPGNPSAEQWCANHGFPTDAGVAAVTGGNATAAQVGDVVAPVTAGSSCNVPLSPNDKNDCKLANMKAMQCMFHGSQLEAQCLAYKTTTTANSAQYYTLGFDIAAASVCATSCAASGISLGVAKVGAWVCLGTGAAAEGAELYATIKQKDSNYIVNAIGVAAGAGGLGVASFGVADKSISGGAGNSQADDCWAAITFAGMAGMRGGNIAIIKALKNDASAAVQKLWSDAQTASGGSNPNGTSQNPSQVTFNQPTGALTPGGPSDSGSGTVGNTTSSTSATDPLACMNTSSTSSTTSATSGLQNCNSTLGLSAGATDSGQLIKTGFDKSLGDLASKIAHDALASDLKGGVGGAMQAAMAGMGGGAGDFGDAVAKLAQTVQDHPEDLKAGAGGSFAASSGGGGASGGAAKPNPFAMMGSLGPATTAPGSLTFDKAKRDPASSDGPDGTDIWHEGFGGSIFQIVSHKLVRTSDRVDRLDYSLPLNRALLGLPPAKKSK